MINQADYVELGLVCADVCKALNRGMNGKQASGLSQPVSEAIEQLTALVESAIHTPGGPLTKLSITGPLQRYRQRSPSEVNETCSPDSFTLRMIKRRSPVGGRTSTGLSMSSKYVLLIGCDRC